MGGPVKKELPSDIIQIDHQWGYIDYDGQQQVEHDPVDQSRRKRVRLCCIFFKDRECKEPCDRDFKTNVDLARHEGTHLKPWIPCTETGCDEKFRQKGHLATHLKTGKHGGSKNEVCICNAAYADRSALIRHVKAKGGPENGHKAVPNAQDSKAARSPRRQKKVARRNGQSSASQSPPYGTPQQSMPLFALNYPYNPQGLNMGQEQYPVTQIGHGDVPAARQPSFEELVNQPVPSLSEVLTDYERGQLSLVTNNFNFMGQPTNPLGFGGQDVWQYPGVAYTLPPQIDLDLFVGDQELHTPAADDHPAPAGGLFLDPALQTAIPNEDDNSNNNVDHQTQGEIEPEEFEHWFNGDAAEQWAA
jgi:hypothetical protein